MTSSALGLQSVKSINFTELITSRTSEENLVYDILLLSFTELKISHENIERSRILHAFSAFKEDKVSLDIQPYYKNLTGQCTLVVHQQLSRAH